MYYAEINKVATENHCVNPLRISVYSLRHIAFLIYFSDFRFQFYPDCTNYNEQF